MKTTSIFTTRHKQTSNINWSFLPTTVLDNYISYSASQEKEKIYWFMKVIIIIPCVIMVPSIILMSMATDNFVWFIGLTMGLFAINMMAHLAEIRSTYFVPIYHFTIFLILLIPTIFYITTL